MYAVLKHMLKEAVEETAYTALFSGEHMLVESCS